MDEKGHPPIAESICEAPIEEVTEDAFLGGQLTIRQPRKGYRAGIDPVFLAASIPARSGEAVLEVGSGVGVASLCLARRAEEAHITALEVQPPLVQLARNNAEMNGLSHRVSFIEGNLLAPPEAIKERMFDHVLANPPYYESESAQASPYEIKARSHLTSDATLHEWIDFSIRRLKPKGRFTLIHRPDALGEILRGFEGRLGANVIFPLWTGESRPAKRIIVTGIKGSSAPLKLMPGMALHEEGRRYSVAAEKILREGQACSLDAGLQG